MKVLGVDVNEIDRVETIKKIYGWIQGRGHLKHVVTIYSEFLLMAEKDKEFKRAITKAELVVPDGVGVLAAMKYAKAPGVLSGLQTGLEGLRGELGEAVTGVWLFEELVRLAVGNGWRVFLLGGFGDTAERLTRKLKRDNPKLVIQSDAGEQRVGENEKENERVIKRINEFKPDLLMVAYGPVVQEKWIYRNKKKLKAKVAIGLGGTFDEVLGEFPKTPVWMEKRGLKALWRLLVQPKRLPRILKGVLVFPWRVFRDHK